MCPHGIAGCRGPDGNLTTTTCPQCSAAIQGRRFRTNGSATPSNGSQIPNNIIIPVLPKPPQRDDRALPVRPPVLPSQFVLPTLPQIPPPLVMPKLPQMPPPIPPPLVMPTLPQIPPQNPWVATRNPSSHLVQKQYVETRLEELGARNTRGKYEAIVILRDMLQKQRNQEIPLQELYRVYDAIEKNLQSAQLTVNFKADAWFTNPNPYDTYTQMYQRAMEGDRMVLRNTEMNDADMRAYADNAITFPKNWQQRDQSPPQRGLRPGRQAPERIQKQMDTGQLLPIHQEGELPAFQASNTHFNPDTKQVFFGLNYGRRPHGSATNYGWSYFVVKDKLKPKCIYYAQDTFMRAEKGVDAGAIQVPYNSLGALIEANKDQHLRDAIFASCYQGMILDDEVKTLCKYFLVEAHHFGDMNFRDHVDHMVISPQQNNGAPLTSNPQLWASIVANAKEFCDRNNVRLYQSD